MRTPRRITLAFSLMLLAALVWAAAAFEAPRRPLPPREGPSLAAGRTWGYQLRNVQADQLDPALDMIVVDYSRDGSDFGAWTAPEVDAIRTRPGGRRRIVLAYLSVGKAESGRFYWWRHWSLLPPAWLGDEEEGQGRYRVRYWDPAWQHVLMAPRPSLLSRIAELQFGWRKSYLDRILEAGFDGVLLAGLEVMETWREENPQAPQEMAALVRKLAAYARDRKPGFLIVPQNGERLLEDARYRAAIDALVTEGLMFGGAGEAKGPADPAALALLTEFAAEGRPVFAVEYVADRARQDEARRFAAEHGFLLLPAVRALNLLPAVQRDSPVPVER